MRTSALLPALSIMSALVWPSVDCWAHGYEYHRIRVPGAVSVYIAGMNASGTVVGSYGEKNGQYHGFIYQDGVVRKLRYPHQLMDGIVGINDQGDLVGFFEGNDGSFNGYLYVSGQFTTLDYPGYAYTTLLGINNAGTVLGYYSVFLTEDPVGFVYSNGVFNDRPFHQGGLTLVPTMINQAGDVASYYQASGPGNVNQGYIVSRGQARKLSVMNAGGAVPTALNNVGGIVGEALAYNGNSNAAFVQGVKNAPPILLQHGAPTSVSGVNDAGDIIGSGTTSFVYHHGAFETLAYHGRVFNPLHINDAGQIVGYIDGNAVLATPK